MLRNNWPVGDHGIRPAGPPDRCFYCNAAKGDQHRAGCVIRSRTVTIRTVVDHVVDIPEDWERGTIDFSFNESSSCADNVIERLGELVMRLNEKSSCTCDLVRVEYLREATEEDETASQLFAAELPA